MTEARSWVRVLSTSRFLAVVEGWGPSQPPSEAVRLLDFLIVEGGEDREPRPWPEPSPVPHPIALRFKSAEPHGFRGILVQRPLLPRGRT